MTVHTDITAGDWSAFVRFVARNVSTGSGGGLGRLLIAVGVGTVVGVMFSMTGAELHFVSLLVGAVGSAMWLIVVARLQARRMIPAADGYILGPRQVTLSDDGVRETSQLHESLFRWNGVRGARFTDQHVFLMMDKNAAILVPRRAFATDHEREGFVAEIQQRATKHATC